MKAVFGASAGVGKALSYALAEEGYDLLLVARDKNAMEAIRSDICAKYPVDIEIVDLIFSTLAVSCVKLDSIEYSKSVSLLFELNDLKNNPSVVVVKPTCVVKPIKFFDLFITNKFCVSPVSGILNVALSPVFDATIRVLPPFVSVTS